MYMKNNEFQPIHDNHDHTNKNYGDTQDLDTTMHKTEEISGMLVIHASGANISNLNRLVLVFTIFMILID